MLNAASRGWGSRANSTAIALHKQPHGNPQHQPAQSTMCGLPTLRRRQAVRMRRPLLSAASTRPRQPTTVQATQLHEGRYTAGDYSQDPEYTYKAQCAHMQGCTA